MIIVQVEASSQRAPPETRVNWCQVASSSQGQGLLRLERADVIPVQPKLLQHNVSQLRHRNQLVFIQRYAAKQRAAVQTLRATSSRTYALKHVQGVYLPPQTPACFGQDPTAAAVLSPASTTAATLQPEHCDTVPTQRGDQNRRPRRWCPTTTPCCAWLIACAAGSWQPHLTCRYHQVAGVDSCQRSGCAGVAVLIPAQRGWKRGYRWPGTHSVGKPRAVNKRTQFRTLRSRIWRHAGMVPRSCSPHHVNKCRKRQCVRAWLTSTQHHAHTSTHRHPRSQTHTHPHPNTHTNLQ